MLILYKVKCPYCGAECKKNIRLEDHYPFKVASTDIARVMIECSSVTKGTFIGDISVPGCSKYFMVKITFLTETTTHRIEGQADTTGPDAKAMPFEVGP